MASFDIAFPISATNEGGWVNNPNDAGGETYRGIARNYNAQWNGWAVIDALKPSGVIKTGYTNANLDALAKTFYKENFWNPLQLDNVKDQSNANQIYDSTLSGLPRTTQMVKKVLNDNFGTNLTLNNTVDSTLVDTLNNVNQANFFNNFKNLRSDLFTYSAAQLPTTNPNYDFFYKFNKNPKASNTEFSSGWANRVNKYIYEGVSQATTATVEGIKKHPLITVMIVVGLVGFIAVGILVASGSKKG